MSQPASQPASQPVSQSVNQSVSQSVSQFILANENTKEIHERTEVENTIRFWF